MCLLAVNLCFISYIYWHVVLHLFLINPKLIQWIMQEFIEKVNDNVNVAFVVVNRVSVSVLRIWSF